MNYTLSEIARVTAGTLGGADRTVTTVLTDSRNQMLRPESVLFVAIRGLNHDGHQYIPELYRRGVRSFLVEEPYAESLYPEATFVVVPDTLEALQALAAHHRSQYHGTVLAITGSNGKTIVKEWIAQLWPGGEADRSGNRIGKLLRSPKSYNSQLGVALSLLLIEGDEELVVIEAGISQPGEMERLQRMIRPDIGILTNIGEAHAENFTSREAKLKEKLKLFAETPAVLYRKQSDPTSTGIEAYFKDRTNRLRGWSPGDFDPATEAVFPKDTIARENLGHVLALYRQLGIGPKPLTELQPVAMRLEMKEGILGSTIINDSYNSDLTSLGIALDYLATHAGETPKAVILSDIFQSNLDVATLYRRVAELMRGHGIACFVGVGPGITAQRKAFEGLDARFYVSTEEFLHRANKEAYAGYYILIKGSRTFGFERISGLLEKRTHTTTLEVNLTAMVSNLNHYRAMLKQPTRVMAMVKAFSYGSGSTEVASTFQHEGVDYLDVAFADEGVTLRQGGIHVPIVVLNSDPGSFGIMADYGLEPEIYSLSSLKSYVREMKSRGMTGAPIHLKLDTGMHRLGFEEPQLPELIAYLQQESAVKTASIFSHLAAADDPAEDEFTRGQIALFDRLSREMMAELGDPGILRHICNSAGARRFPEAHFDMVRLGIACYGTESPDLQVVSTLKTQIVQIKNLHQGDTVGYNRRGVIHGETRVATIPIGYADGMDRKLSCGKGFVNVKGVLCPIVGNVCMDTCMIEVSAVEGVQEGDEVIIFGAKPTAKAVAGWLGTISYEVLTSVSARIKRVYTRE